MIYYTTLYYTDIDIKEVNVSLKEKVKRDAVIPTHAIVLFEQALLYCTM